MQNSDKLRNMAMPFLMIGLGLMAVGFNTHKDIFLYLGIAAMAAGIAFLKASVWGRTKGSRRWRRTDEEESPASPKE